MFSVMNGSDAIRTKMNDAFGFESQSRSATPARRASGAGANGADRGRFARSRSFPSRGSRVAGGCARTSATALLGGVLTSR
jgi:hypothetical protein